MMSQAATLSLKHVFGAKGDRPNCVCHVEEHKICYIAGHNVVTFNLEEKSQSFYPGIDGSDCITSLCISPMRRYLAVAEKSQKGGMVFVYDTTTQRKKRHLIIGDIQAQEFVSMAFAPGQEGKYLVTLSGAPDWTLVYWQWDKPRPLAHTKASQGQTVYQVSFNPQDINNGLIVTGNNVFRWFKFIDQNFKPIVNSINKKDPSISSNYLSHCWTPDGKIIIGTDAGEILLLDQNCDFKQLIQSSPLDGWGINILIPYSKGFICAGDEATIYVFERNQEDLKNPYVRSQNSPIKIEQWHTNKIAGLSIAPASEDNLIAVLDNNQIYQISLQLTSMGGEEKKSAPLTFTFHSKQITGMDVCIRKHLLVTCSLDKSIKIWNYADRILESETIFNEEPYSVAFHPSGFHIVVGFSDKLSMMNVLKDTVRSYKTFQIKNVKEVVFSHGGHLFAAASGQQIYVIPTYTGEILNQLQFKGHSGKIRAISWTEDDTGFVSTGTDGMVMEWKIWSKQGSGDRIQECPCKGIVFSSAIVISEGKTTEGNTIYVAGSDKTLREIQDSSVINTHETLALFGQIQLSHSGKLLFAGISELDRPGSIRSYKFPYTGEYFEVQAHSQAVERMRVSFDDKYLFTGGVDGNIMIFEIKDRESRGMKGGKEMFGLPPAEEILITKQEIYDFYSVIDNYKAENHDLQNRNKYQFEMEIANKNEQITKLRDQMMLDAQQERMRYESLEESMKEKEEMYEKKLNELKEAHELDKQHIETNYQQKVMIEVTRYQDLSKQKDQEEKSFQSELEKKDKEYQQKIRELEEDFKQKQQSEQEDRERLFKEKEDLIRRHEEIREQIERENDRAINDLTEKSQTEMLHIKDTSLKAKGELNLVKKKFQNQQQELERYKDEIKQHLDQIEVQKKEIESLNKERLQQKKEIDERDKTIGDKEKRIYDLKKKNQELEKFKFVLDYKIKELKREIGPREEEISKMREQTNEMDKELKHLQGVNVNLGLIVDDLRMRQEGMQNDILKQRSHISKLNHIIEQFKNDVYKTSQKIQDPKGLKIEVIELYKKYVQTEVLPTNVDQDMQKENTEQRKYLEQQIQSLKQKLQKEAERHKQDNIRIMKENADLILQINDLRKEVGGLNNLKKFAELHSQQKQQNQTSRTLTKSSTQGPKRQISQEEASKLENLKKEIEIQKEMIQNYKKQVEELQGQLQQSQQQSYRPPSQQRLPSIDQHQSREVVDVQGEPQE